MKEYWIDKESGRVEAYADLSGIVDKNESRDPYGVPTGSVPRTEACPHGCVRENCPDCHGIRGNVPPLPKTGTFQVGGNHYAKLSMQPWDFVAANNLGYFEGSIIKYVTRWRDKGGLEDLKKARHFLDKLIEVSS